MQNFQASACGIAITFQFPLQSSTPLKYHPHRANPFALTTNPVYSVDLSALPVALAARRIPSTPNFGEEEEEEIDICIQNLVPY